MAIENARKKREDKGKKKEKHIKQERISRKAKGILHLALYCARGKVDFVVVQQPKSALNWSR